MNIGYSRQFIRALAFFESVNIGEITKAMHTKENIISKKHIQNKKPCLIYRVLLKNTFVNNKLRAIPLRPRKVFANTLPNTMVVNLEGQQNKFSRVPI
jgi:hypothetical protein